MPKIRQSDAMFQQAWLVHNPFIYFQGLTCMHLPLSSGAHFTTRIKIWSQHG